MQWIYPYKTLFGDVEASLHRIRVDEETIPESLIDRDHRVIDLADSERGGWDTAQFSVEVRASRAEIEELGSQAAEPGAVAVLHCSGTNTRQALWLEADEDEIGVWNGSFDLDRATWFGRISVRATITATVDGIPKRVIGSAPAWAVELDDQPRRPVHGAIKIMWDSFIQPEELKALKRYNSEPAFLHLDPDEPVLYLNRDIEGLYELLSDRRGRGAAEEALHDQARATVASEAWLAMANAALMSIRVEDDEEPEWPESEWQRDALEIVLHRMYPDKALEDALRQVAGLRTDPTAARAVQQLLMPAISEQVGVARLMRGAIRRLNPNSQLREA